MCKNYGHLDRVLAELIVHVHLYDVITVRVSLSVVSKLYVLYVLCGRQEVVGNELFNGI